MSAAAKPAAKPFQDREVLEAGSRLDGAKARVRDLGYALDETAAAYEQANAHRIRLEDGMRVSAERVEDAQANAVDAEQDRDRQVAAAYKHPGGDMGVQAALLDAPDTASLLHRTALYRRVAVQSAAEADAAHRITEMTTTDARQEQIVAAGTAASIKEWERHAKALRTALDAAEAEVSAAETGLVSAREAAARRAEAERQAAAARAAFVEHTGAAPATLPDVDGMVCPVGQPNGFIDSWGFPRSGGRSHEGVDMFAPYGTPIFAVADGVIYRVYDNPLGGLSINLIDTKGNMYYYTHLSAASAMAGQVVHAGDPLGNVGTSGNAAGTPPHLHWQFHPGNGAPVNPYPLAYALCR